MLEINLHLYLCLLLIFNYFRNGASVNYNPYDNKQQHHLLHTTNAANDGYNAQQSGFNVNPVYQPNLQGNSNYQQLYRYYYNPPNQQQQPLQSQQQSTQLWSGPPIIVEDGIQYQQPKQWQSSTNIPPTFYQQQYSTGSIKSSTESLPFLSRHSKVLAPTTVYNPQPTTTRTAQAYFTSNNNNNNNIIYHRDFRHEIYDIPESERIRQEHNRISWNNQQQQQQRNQLLELQQPQQKFYSSGSNLSHNGIYNDLLATSLRKVHVADYREHFKRYLENNPHRIKPIY